MKIIFYCISEKLSGGELYTLKLAAALRDAGEDVSIAAPKSSPVAREAVRRRINLTDTSVGPKLGRKTALRIVVTLPALVLRFRRELKLHDSDTLVVLQYKLEQLLFGLVGPSRTRLAVLEHGPIPKPVLRFPLRFLYNRTRRRAETLIAASRPAAKDLGARAHLVLAGIDPEIKPIVAPMQPTPHRTPSDRDQDALRFIFAGRLTEAKGVRRCLAFAQSDPNVQLVVAGAGPLEREVLDAADRYANIRYVGEVLDVAPLIAASDFSLLLTSDPGEGRPLAALESISLGTPVIALQSSHAMQSLVEEVGNRAVRLVRDAAPDQILSAAGDRSRLSVDLPTWADAARDFGVAVASRRA